MERALRPAAKATVLNSSAEANAVFHSCNFPSEKEYGGSRATDMTGFTVGDFPPPEAQVLATQSCGKSGNPAIYSCSQCQRRFIPHGIGEGLGHSLL